MTTKACVVSNLPIFFGSKIAVSSNLSLNSRLALFGYIEKLGILGKDKVTFREGITFFTVNWIYLCWWLGQSPNLNKFFSSLIWGQLVLPLVCTTNGSLSSN